jgi:Sec-independent protein translocase protein TatA
VIHEFRREILFVLVLALVVLGPKRLHTILIQVMRAKARFENVTRDVKAQLEAELHGETLVDETSASPESAIEHRSAPPVAYEL